MATPVVLTTGARPITPVESGGVPMTPVDTLGEPVTVVDALGEPVVLINNDGTPAYLAYSAKTYLGGVAPYHWLDFINNRALYAGADVGNVTQATGYSFSRASQGYYQNSDGTLTLFGYNLLTWSEDFSNAAWTQASLTIGADAAVAPNGTTTADSLTRTTTSSAENNERQTTAQAVSTSYTLSVYVKANTAGARLYLRNLAIDNSTTTGVVQFNPADGTISLTYGSTYTGKASMTNEGNGWYRCQITGSTGGSITNNLIDVGVTDGTSAVGGTAGNSIFAWGAQLDQAAQATAYVPTTSAAAGALRRGDRGVLIEGSRTNLLTYSQQFDNAAWAAYGAKTITPNSTIAPDGTLTADTFTSTTAGNGINQVNIAVSASTAYRFSLFVKAGAQGTRLSVNAPQYNAGNAYLGDLFSSSPNITAGTALANGWYRHDFGGTTEATTSKVDVRIVAFANNDAYIIWQADLQAGAFPSSPIITVAASATRAADSLVYTAGASYPASLWCEFDRGVASALGQVALQLDGGDDTNRSTIRANASGEAEAVMASGAVTQAQMSVAGAMTPGTASKVGARYSTNSVQIARAGTLGTEDTSATVPAAITTLRLGARAAGDQYLFGYVARAAVFNSALTNAQLQTVST